jgi:predicted nucleic acid-binding protein
VSDFLLDTDVLIRCLRGHPETLRLARSLTEEGDLHISVWSQVEILMLTRPGEEKRTLDFLSSFILHPISEAIAQCAAAFLRTAATTGTPLRFAEAVIAATALQHGLTLVRHNVGNLRQLEELKIPTLSTAAVQRGVT